jgi:hypothetical protein
MTPSGDRKTIRIEFEQKNETMKLGLIRLQIEAVTSTK